LDNQIRSIHQADFFTTEVWTVRGLVTYYTALVMELHSRRVHLLGSTPHPDEAFIVQTMRHSVPLRPQPMTRTRRVSRRA